MPVKRSRISRSPSFGEADLLNQVSAPFDSTSLRLERWNGLPSSSVVVPSNNIAKILKSSVVGLTDQSRRKVLTISSPAQESDHFCDDEKMGGFLEKCYYCQKKILENSEVFMYSNLRAFCTAECRDVQIALDKVVEKHYAKSEEGFGQHNGLKIVKG